MRSPGGARCTSCRAATCRVVAARAALRGGLLAEDAEHLGPHGVPRLDVAARHREPLGGGVRARGREPRRRHRRLRRAQQLRPHARGAERRARARARSVRRGAPRARVRPERARARARRDARRDRAARGPARRSARSSCSPSSSTASIPIGMPTLGSAEVIRALDARRVLAHHERLVRARNLVIAVAGDVDPDAVAHALAARLARARRRATSRRPPRRSRTAPREIRRAELIKDRAQAHLVIGFRGVSRRRRGSLRARGDLAAARRPERPAVPRAARPAGPRLLGDRDERRGLAPGYFAVYIATAPEKLEEARSGPARPAAAAARRRRPATRSSRPRAAT